MKSTLSKTLKTSFFSNQKIRNRKICNSNLFALSVFVVVYEFLNNSLIDSHNQRERIVYHHTVGLISRKKKLWLLKSAFVACVPNDLDWYTLISFPSINHAWVDFIICNKLKIYYCRHHVLLSNTIC